MNETIYKPIIDVVLSVDSREWYYGRKANVNDSNKKILVKSCVPSNSTKTEEYSRFINDLFLWMQTRERDTLKRKKRSFYVDIDLFKSESFKFS